MKKEKLNKENLCKLNPIVGVVMGSKSDWKVMKYSVNILKKFNITYEAKVISAHRMPDEMFEYAELAKLQGIIVIIAGAGGSAHLPGMMASKTTIPVLGVPIPVGHLNGIDALYSIVQMPTGVPVATFAIGKSGAINAALFAVSILSISSSQYYNKIQKFRKINNQESKSVKLTIS